jgi:hypothetical protein
MAKIVYCKKQLKKVGKRQVYKNDLYVIGYFLGWHKSSEELVVGISEWFSITTKYLIHTKRNIYAIV